MLGVFLTQYGMFCRDMPVNAEAVVKNTNTTVNLWMIKIIAFILEYSHFA